MTENRVSRYAPRRNRTYNLVIKSPVWATHRYPQTLPRHSLSQNRDHPKTTPKLTLGGQTNGLALGARYRDSRKGQPDGNV